MKKSLLLVALLGLTISAVVTGCDKPADTTTTTPAATNAPAAP